MYLVCLFDYIIDCVVNGHVPYMFRHVSKPGILSCTECSGLRGQYLTIVRWRGVLCNVNRAPEISTSNNYLKGLYARGGGVPRLLFVPPASRSGGMLASLAASPAMSGPEQLPTIGYYIIVLYTMLVYNILYYVRL